MKLYELIDRLKQLQDEHSLNRDLEVAIVCSDAKGRLIRANYDPYVWIDELDGERKLLIETDL